MSAYVLRLKGLLDQIPSEILPTAQGTPTRPRVPTRAFSEFLINRELGDWAEDVVQRGVNDCGLDVSAVRYGRTENLVAGEPGFAEFFSSYHEELQSFGKRPDLLVFRRDVVPNVQFEGRPAGELAEAATQAAAGFEVRSSQQSLGGTRTPADLSFTPKIEDVRNVMRWIERHKVPHFYVQVVFGAVYAISFERIIELLVEGPKAGGFAIDREPRNQFKSTVYIPLDKGICLSTDFVEPDLSAFRKQLSSGRMLFGVKFSGGKAVLDRARLAALLNVPA